MKKIRIGNDFVFNWAIERGGVPENLETVLEKHLYMIVFGAKTEIHNYTVSGNKIIVEFTPEMLNKIGIYTLIFYYVLPDESLSDNDRKCAVDIDAFQIVPRTAMADDVTEFAVTSDMAIAFKGDKGDSAYQVWLDAGNVGTEEDYFAYLRQPANDIAETVNLQEQARADAENTRRNNEEQRVEAEDIRLSNEQSRVEAEGLRASGEVSRNTAEGIRVSSENTRIENEEARELAEDERKTAETTRVSNENNRVTAEQERVNAESLRVTAESSRELAESLRVEAEIVREQQEQDRQINTATAITNAETATENANTAAQNADDAREAIQSDLGAKAFHGYASVEVAKTLKQVEDDTINTTEKPTAQSLSELNARITALEAIISNKIKDRIDVTKEFNVWGKTNLILYGNGASTKAPDFIGQTYIDTTNGNVYIAVGVSNAGNWKLV